MEISFETSDNLNTRLAGEDDKEFAYQAKRAAFRGYVEQVWGWDEDKQRKLHDQRFTAQDFCVISLDGTDVGIMSVDLEPDSVFVNQIYILPEHQKQGIGRRCMSIVVEEAKKLNLPVRLRVLKVNPRAVVFYERLGFTIAGDTDTHLLMQKV
ncbi:MAG: GNAT family N-acetyltransferase [Dehalococcoidia bacterium]|nr:GNAT family N-acetyltransferase [Dehalococcoidia bacterium]